MILHILKFTGILNDKIFESLLLKESFAYQDGVKYELSNNGIFQKN
jgi:hypothetical protein